MANHPFDEDEKTDPNLQVKGVISPKNVNVPSAPKVKMPDLGILNSIVEDSSVTEIMINDLRNIYVERNGQLEWVNQKLSGLDELNRIVRNILDFTGRVLSSDQPYVDLMLPDGSRVNLVAPPLVKGGTCLTIRRFPKRYSIHELIKETMLNEKMRLFLEACLNARVNILIAGGTGSGKTTFLNALGGIIPVTERIVTIEETPEVVLPHPNLVQMQIKPQTAASSEIGARELVRNTLRMRPDRVIIGEVRGSEAFELLQAMNTGHGGMVFTLHSNTARDSLDRFETLCLLAATGLPHLAIRRQIAKSLDVIVHIRRYRDGSRRVDQIAEVTGMEGEVVTMSDIFAVEASGNGAGPFKMTGFVPHLVESLEEKGIQFPPGFFEDP